MEQPNDNITPDGSICPCFISLAKVLMCVTAAAFVMWLPLSGLALSEDCALAFYKPYLDSTLVCVCNFYNDVFIKYARKLSDVSKVLFWMVRDILYKIKIMFYCVLEKFDGDDLCRSICCSRTSADGRGGVEPDESCHSMKTCS